MLKTLRTYGKMFIRWFLIGIGIISIIDYNVTNWNADFTLEEYLQAREIHTSLGDEYAGPFVKTLDDLYEGKRACFIWDTQQAALANALEDVYEYSKEKLALAFLNELKKRSTSADLIFSMILEGEQIEFNLSVIRYAIFTYRDKLNQEICLNPEDFQII